MTDATGSPPPTEAGLVAQAPPPGPPEPPPPLGGKKPSASVALPLNATVTILKHATCGPAQPPRHRCLVRQRSPGLEAGSP